MSCLGRERLFEHFSRTLGIPVVLLRLNYACELRYGVLVDLARRIWTGQPVDVGMGWFNCLWQGDANAMTLQSFALARTPPHVLNLTGPELLSVRTVAEQLGHRMHRPVSFTGSEGQSALLNHAGEALRRFGPPRVAAAELIGWAADWVMQGAWTSASRPTLRAGTVAFSGHFWRLTGLGRPLDCASLTWTGLADRQPTPGSRLGRK